MVPKVLISIGTSCCRALAVTTRAGGMDLLFSFFRGEQAESAKNKIKKMDRQEKKRR
jgi:hypothetical protein